MLAFIPASRRTLLVCTTAAILAACASPPDLGAAPRLSTPDQYESIESFAAPVSAWPSDRWWENYGDLQLNALIEEALADSPSLQIAAARLRRAQADATFGCSAGSIRERSHASPRMPPC